MSSDNGERYVRNRTSAETFVRGHGVVPGHFEGYLENSDAVSALVGAHVFADVKPPEPLTSKQQAAQEAEGLGIEFDYDTVTERELRDLIQKEGGS